METRNSPAIHIQPIRMGGFIGKPPRNPLSSLQLSWDAGANPKFQEPALTRSGSWNLALGIWLIERQSLESRSYTVAFNTLQEELAGTSTVSITRGMPMHAIGGGPKRHVSITLQLRLNLPRRAVANSREFLRN